MVVLRLLSVNSFTMYIYLLYIFCLQEYTLSIERSVVLMATTMVNIRMDEDVKRDMEQTCKDLGMNMTTAFTIFAKKMGRERRIPFEVSVDPFYSEENLAHLRRSLAELDAGKGTVHELIEDE